MRMTKAPRTAPSTTNDAVALRHCYANMTRVLLVCGILSSVAYASMLAFIPMRWPSYDSASWTVSELSAIDAPTRSLWVSSSYLWTLLYIAFGVGENQTKSGLVEVLV